MLTFLIPFAFPFFIQAIDVSTTCINEASILKIDAQYEKALIIQDIDFLSQHLHPEFVWVHNHADFINYGAESILQPMRERISAGRNSSSKKRQQSDVRVISLENTAVIYGFTEIERTEEYVSQTGNPHPVKYHFMRTYVEQEGVCRLVANHTMEVGREGE